MAQPTTNGCLKGCLITALVAILVIVLVVVIGSVVVLNMTPEQLHIADMKISENDTLRSMGLADTKLIDIIKSLQKLMTEPNESEIVNNGYDEGTEKTTAENAMDNGSLEKKEDGSYDYTPILSNKVVYDKQYLKSYADTTIAYIFDNIIKSNTATTNSGMDMLRELNASVLEVTITENGSKYEMRIVVCANIGKYTEEIAKDLPSFVPVPQKIYIVSYSEISVNEEGKIVATSKDICINDTQDVVADAIFKVLSKEVDGADDKNGVNGEILSAFADVIYNLGQIGTANVLEGTDEISDGVTLGVQGLRNHGFTVVTHLKPATEPELPELEEVA